MHVHEQVLEAANQIACGRADWTFGVDEVVRALPQLNESSVRTHVVSRCCVNAPKHHLHKWPYFRRVGRGRYQVEAAYRRKPPARDAKKKKALEHESERVPGPRREAIHAIIQQDGPVYVAECLELAVVTQGKTLDEVVENLRQALALHLEDEDMAALGLAERPRVQLLYDTALAS
jgi:predicted RNase H-like HicB family nuclease